MAGTWFRELGEADEAAQDFRPDACSGGGGIWAAWMRYRTGSEEIRVQYVKPAERQDAEVGALSGEEPSCCVSVGERNDRPKIELCRGVPVVVWQSGQQASDDQTLVWSTLSNGEWRTPRPICRADAIPAHSFSSHARSDTAWVAWVERARGRVRLSVASFTGSGWAEPVAVPTNGTPNRPCVTANEHGGCLLTWDEYSSGLFTVWAAVVEDGKMSMAACVSGVVPDVLEDSGGPEPAAGGAQLKQPKQLSQVGPAWDFNPTATLDGGGSAWVAWLHLVDVQNEDGVVDQFPTLRCAARSTHGWVVVSDPSGSVELADLAWGLLPYKDAGVWGYLGRRRTPVLVCDDLGRVWLLWERKEGHDAPTGRAGGVLCGRLLGNTGISDMADDTGCAGPPDAAGTQAGGLPSPRSESVAFAVGPRYYVPISIADSATPKPRVTFTGRCSPQWGTRGLIVAEAEGGDVLQWESEAGWCSWRRIAVHPHCRCAEIEDTEGNRLFWADLHVHTGLSADAEGELDELIYYARDKSEVDCVILQDNDHYNLSLTPSEYDQYLKTIRHYSKSGGFLLLPGYEWTYYPVQTASGRTANHRTVFSASPHFPILRNVEAGNDPERALCGFLEDHDGYAHIHHQRFSMIDHPREINFEVCSGWGAHMADEEHRVTYHGALRDGRRRGFIGGSDSHRRNPGMCGALTGVFAPALTVDSVVQALVAHRCFATTGSRIVPMVWVDQTFMGGNVTVTDPPVITWKAFVTKPPAEVELVRDGAVVASWSISGNTDTDAEIEGENKSENKSGSGTLTDHDLEPGEHFYYLQVRQSGAWRHLPSNLAVAEGPHAWSSPIWVTRR